MLGIVTGATGGLGFEVACGLVRAGLDVVMTGRDEARGAAALARLRASVPGGHGVGSARFALLDVSRLDSVAAFAGTVDGPVSVLVNNAGVMGLPRRTLTPDGFETQFATNHLGHFALTCHLLPQLRGGRVVPVASVAHRKGAIAFDDLQGERSYEPFRAYAQSKLANLMFGRELQRRSAAAGWGVTAVAAHPGWSATRIVVNGVGGGRGLVPWVMQAGFSMLGQSAAAGARPLLFAALDAGAEPGGYYGPCCLWETRGRPTRSVVMPQARDAAACARLWDVSAELTGAAVPGA